jgi:hypothetical protein
VTKQSGINTLNRLIPERCRLGSKDFRKMFNASRTMRKAARFELTGSLGQEVSSRQEEASRFEAHTPFDEAVSS